jgi:predicted ATPase/DNA-binding SARP family transcriptional activator/DNA-binding CsgD family transcriptional regulator
MEAWPPIPRFLRSIERHGVDGRDRAETTSVAEMNRHNRPATPTEPNGVAEARPEAIRIELLGGFRVSVGSRTIEGGAWRLRKAASLVKLLALSPGHHLHREQVMDLLWPDMGRKAVSNSLRQTLYVARRVLSPDTAMGSRYLRSAGESLALCPGSDLWVDVGVFEDAASKARRTGEPAAYQAAIDLYTGELLPTDRYEDWADVPREQLRRTYSSLLSELAGLYEKRGEYERAVGTLQRIVASEPESEDAHMGLMRLFAISGRRGEALGQYERLREGMKRGSGAEPGVDVRRLHQDIEAGRLPAPHLPPVAGAPEHRTAARRHNLPVPRTSFVGRERELPEVKRTLSMTRLLTLTGTGGAGKTRLAMEVASDLVGVYSGGVWLVELAGLPEEALVPQAVAGALGVQEQPDRPLTDTLLEALRGKEMLLVIDNCEHLVEAAAHLVDVLLDNCTHLRILATSREALAVAGEVRWPVPPLSVPHLQRLPTVEELEGYESARLFAERARHRDPSFALTSASAQSVAEICRRLDGIPLALELAAARIGALSPEQISERLGDSLGLLTGGGRTATPRQRTLRGALDWSHDLLSETEKRLFGRLSVFAGGWTLEAAEFLGSGNGVDKNGVIELLSGLVNKSLVAVQPAGADGVRYRFLEPIRRYALERLEDSRESEEIQRRHAEFFLALAEEAEPRLRGPDQTAWRRRLDAELDNLRGALGWLLGHGEIEAGLKLGSALLFFWMWRGSLREGSRWLEEGLNADRVVTELVRAKALNHLADLTIMLSDYQRSHALLEESLSLYRAAGDENGVAACKCDLGWLAAFQGDYRRATELLEESLVRLRESEDTLRIAFALNRLGGLATGSGEYDRAAALLGESLALYREVQDDKSTAMCLSMLGYVSFRQEDPDRAVSQIEESMALIREAGLTADAFTLTVLANAVMVRGEHERARGLIKDALVWAWKAGNRLHAIQALETEAMLAVSRGDPRAAAALWGAGEAAREVLGAPLDLDDCAMYEPCIATAREELGEGAWRAAWEEGRETTLEEAVDYVLSGEKPAAPARPAPVGRRPSLTRREGEVAALVAQGLTNRRIAGKLFVSKRTVDHHVASILKKLGVVSREQVASRLEDG